MKYDCVIGNPPYQNPNVTQKGHKLYSKFVKLSLELLKIGGYLAYVTPDSWVKGRTLESRNLKNDILKYNLSVVKDADHHFNIGESVSYFIVSNEAYKGHTEIYDFEGHIDDMPKSIEDTICDKVYTYDNNIKSRRIRVVIEIPDRPNYFKNERTDEYNIRVYHTIPQTFWARPTIAEWAYTPKVILNGSGYYRVWRPEEPAVSNKTAFTILCEDETHAIKAAKWLNHKLFHFIIETQRTGGFVGGYWNMFPYPERNIVDINPYKYFGLTPEEIGYVEQYHIKYEV